MSIEETEHVSPLSPLSPPPDFTRGFKLRYSEVDRNGRMKLDAFFDYFQETASEHADLLGCGFRLLQGLGRFWVLSRLRLRIARVPQTGARIEVKTWPSGAARRMFAVRQAVFTDVEGAFADISSCWLMIDSKSGHPLRIPEELPCALPDNSALPMFSDATVRLTVQGTGRVLPFIVTEHMIDVNAHMNNARYASMTSDWLSMALGHPALVKEIAVNYLAATPVGARLETSGRLEADGAFQIAIDGGVPGEERVRRFVASGVVAG